MLYLIVVNSFPLITFPTDVLGLVIVARETRGGGRLEEEERRKRACLIWFGFGLFVITCCLSV